jgi:DNA-binding transcriptional MerR regulator
MNTQGTMRIGEVHALLRREIPDIELSKIRYYEDKGLVAPQRSRKGYRLYSQRDVECLREAIRLANEEFVPLRVVRLRLIEKGLLDESPVSATVRQVARSATNVVSIPVPNPATTHLVATKSAIDVGNLRVESLVSTGESETTLANVVPLTSHETPDESDAPQTYSATEFLVKSGLDATVMNQLVATGFLVPSMVADQAVYSRRDLHVARSASELLERGVDVRILASLRRIVAREIGLLDDVTRPLYSPRTTLSAAQAHSVVHEVAKEVETLRAALFARALSEYLGI